MDKNYNYEITLLNATRLKWESILVSYVGRPRTYFSFLYMLNGSIECTWRGKRYSLVANDVFFLPRGGEYTLSTTSETGQADALIIDFDTDSFDIENCPMPPFSIYHDTERRYAEIMENAVVSYQKGGYNSLITRAAIYNFMHIFIGQNIADTDNNFIREAKGVLAGHNDYSIEEIANMLFVSSSNFRKKFRMATGMSPAEYRNSKRIERAKRLLRENRYSVSEVASMCLFYDVSHFCKIFKKQTSMSPKEYQEKH